jgi:hypothetical protein
MVLRIENKNGCVLRRILNQRCRAVLVSALSLLAESEFSWMPLGPQNNCIRDIRDDHQVFTVLAFLTLRMAKERRTSSYALASVPCCKDAKSRGFNPGSAMNKTPEECGKCSAEIDPTRRVDFTLKNGTRVCEQCFVKETPRVSLRKFEWPN